ncbi:MAG: erythronate-4-phosphate dehydrogenase, partial [Bacteroidota bacterium]|nr:erythronate-4-phosphate dehydrogenase [Candidatus Kapabacteria bacterium]MDW8220754.1 erythronate-4-phosphate dehydrogenase [Bacteroidota bacterium]
MTIAIDAQIPLLAEALESNHHMKILRFYGRNLSQQMLHDCIALCVRSTTRVNASLLTGTPIRFVGTATSGTEHIDIDFLHSHGITFADAKGCNANSVAEYVIFAMLLWAESLGLLSSTR